MENWIFCHRLEEKADDPLKVAEKPGLKEGDTVVFQEGDNGSFIIKLGKKEDFDEWFRKLILAEPRRTGKPENWSPAKMKRTWKTE